MIWVLDRVRSVLVLELSLSLSLFVCESWKSFEGKMKVALVLRLKLVILRSMCN